MMMMMMMVMMMIQFSMLMLMVSSAALVYIHKMSTSSVDTFTFAAQVVHLYRSQASSSEKVETSETYKTSITFGIFGVESIQSAITFLAITYYVCTHLSIHNLLWRFEAVQHHKSLSWANTNYHCAANGGYLTSCGGNWISIYFFYQNLVGLRKKLNVPLFLCFTLPPTSFTLKNDTIWLEACRVL
jgi:hypothetical protein